MIRGDLVTISVQGDFGKPRPALVIQADPFADHSTVTVLLVTGTLVDAPLLRVAIEPDKTNHLRKPSQVMVDKTMTVARAKAGNVFGRLKAEQMLEVSRCLAEFLGIAR